MEWLARQEEATIEAYDHSSTHEQTSKIQGKREILFAIMDLPEEVANREAVEKNRFEEI